MGVELQIKQGNKKAKYAAKIIDMKENVISSLLLSNNLVNILASSLATAFFYNLFGIKSIRFSTLSLQDLVRWIEVYFPKVELKVMRKSE